ncbi:MAG: enoyl-CoA hydratase/isomerase family protein [Promethearchaeia archaeon]
MPEYDTIEVEINKEHDYATLSLNRPKKLNALNTQLADDFIAAANFLESQSLRCLIITGKGKAFCSGGDLAEFQKNSNPNFLHNLAKKFHKGIKILKEKLPPSIAAINGACMGVGLSLATACDLRICSKNSQFAIAFTNVGLSPDSGLTFHLPKLIGIQHAKELALLNKTIDSHVAKKMGLVLEIYEPEDLLDQVIQMATTISNGPTVAFESILRLFDQSTSNDLDAQLTKELTHVKKTSSTEDFQKGLRAFLERRKPEFQGK